MANYDGSNVVGFPLAGPYRTPKVTLSIDVASPQGLVLDPAVLATCSRRRKAGFSE